MTTDPPAPPHRSQPGAPGRRPRRIRPDPMAARGFLNVLSHDEGITFEVRDDDRARNDPALTWTLRGTLRKIRPRLTLYNKQGAGVFVRINQAAEQSRETSGKGGGGGSGRSDSGIIRALFVDLRAPSPRALADLPLKPHAIIEAAPFRWLVFWGVEGIATGEFPDLQRTLAARFAADPGAAALPSLAPLPGFFRHAEQPFKTQISQLNPGALHERTAFLGAFDLPGA